MHLSTVETVLEYQVDAPTHFCFNIEAAHWPTQKILSERLHISSGVTPHRYTEARSGNRFIRFDAAPGPLALRYKAEVEVLHLKAGEEIRPHNAPTLILHMLTARTASAAPGDSLRGTNQSPALQTTEPGTALMVAIHPVE